MKRTRKLVLLSTLAAGCTIGTAIAVSPRIASAMDFVKKSVTPSYALTLGYSNRVTAEQVTAGEATYKTTLGNDVTFELHDVSTWDDGYCQLENIGSYVAIKSTNKISGLESLGITTTAKKSSYMVYAGSDADHIVYKQIGSSNSGTWVSPTKDFTFGAPVNYVKIVNIGANYTGGTPACVGPVYLKTLKFNYNCVESPLADIVEAKSEDMTNGMSVLSDWWWPASCAIDYKDTKVNKSTSGYCVHYSGDETTTGWPAMVHGFSKLYDLTGKGLQFDMKFHVLHKWIGFRLVDASGEALTNEMGYDLAAFDTWETLTFSASKLAENLLEDKSLAEVAGFKIAFNFDEHQGNYQECWLDEMHPIEEVTLENNLENMVLDAGDTKSTVTKDFSEHKGANSTNSIKLTFENAGDLNDNGNTAIRTTFNHEVQYGSSAPVLNSGVLAFDVKPSEEILLASSTEKHSLVMNIIEEGWAGQSAWIDIHTDGKWGYLPHATEDGWFHFSVNLAENTNFNKLTKKTIRIELSFKGVTNATKSTASINLDNFTWTPAA